MTEHRIRYWRHVNRPAVIDWAYADSAGTVEFFTGSPYWVEVTVTPIVSGDVIERTARALHAWDVEGGPCEGPWESLTPEQHEVWLSGARALADAGLLAGSRAVTPEQREATEAVLTTSPHMLLGAPDRRHPSAEQVARILAAHQPATGMVVASGVTCRCGYWTGGEQPGVTRPPGLSGLTWHQAQEITGLTVEEGGRG